MVSSPSAAHESILNTVMEDLARILTTIPIPPDIVCCRVCPNTGYQSELICAIPDLTILMFSKRLAESPRLLQTIWVMESTFNQSDNDVMEKLRCYTHSNPDLLVAGKIIVKQSRQWSSPGSIKSLVKNLCSSELVTQVEWPGIYGNAAKYLEVVVDKYSWFSLSSAELHLWIRKPGATKIDLDCRDGDSYAFGVRHH